MEPRRARILLESPLLDNESDYIELSKHINGISSSDLIGIKHSKFFSKSNKFIFNIYEKEEYLDFLRL